MVRLAARRTWMKPNGNSRPRAFWMPSVMSGMAMMKAADLAVLADDLDEAGVDDGQVALGQVLHLLLLERGVAVDVAGHVALVHQADRMGTTQGLSSLRWS